MITVKYIPNLLSVVGRKQVLLHYSRNKTLEDFLKEAGFDYRGKKIIISGRVTSDLGSLLDNDDEIIIAPDIKHPIAAIVAVFHVIAASAIFQVVSTAVLIFSVVYSIYQALQKPRLPSFGSGEGLDEGSPTYGWDGIRTMQDVGIPVAVVYGEHKVGGNIINQFVYEDVFFEWHFRSVTPANAVNSGYINTFSVNSDCRGIGFNIYANTYLKQTVVQGSYTYYYYDYVSYKVEYKKTSESSYRVYSQNLGGGRAYVRTVGPKEDTISYYDRRSDYSLQINELEEAQYDVRITLNEAVSSLQNQQYYHSLSAKVKEASASHTEKQYLNLLLGLCEGEIEEIKDIKINDNPASNFSGVEIYQRYGTNDQAAIANFNELHNVYNINAQLTKDNPYTYTTVDPDVEGFEVHLSLPNGLYQQNSSSGAIEAWSVTYKVEYKLHSESSWSSAGEVVISKKSRSPLRRTFRQDGLSAGQYDIRITRISSDSDFYHTGDLYLQYIDEIKTDDLAYPNTALLGLKMLATDQLSGSTPNINCVVKGRKVRVPKVMYGTEEVSWEDYYWDSASSCYRRFSDDAALSWDGTSYVERFCANPIWCLRDLLINSRFGLGEFIDTSQLDDDLLLEMSRYCEEKVSDGNGGYEKRFRLDVVIDSSTKALDLISQLCATFRGMAFYSAGAIKLRIDKEEDAVQLFGMGNIIADSFKQSWKSVKDRPNVIEVQFLDKDKDYKQETIAVIDEDALASGQPMRKKQIRLFTTRISQALREGRYALWLAKYIDRVISFKAAIDAVAVQPGDVIYVSHDVPQWGYSGRVKGGTLSSVELDREVTLEAGKTYRVMVRFSDDTIEERTVSDPAGSYTTLHVSSDFSQVPQAYDVYAFGQSSKVKKPFRVISMQKDSHSEVALTAVEYNASIYDDSDIPIPTTHYSALSSRVPDVEDLQLTERLVKLKDGTIEDAIDVWFRLPSGADYYVKRLGKVRIYLSEDSGQSWVLCGETTSEHFAIVGGIRDGGSYKVAVVSVSDKGEENSISSSPSADITVLGESTPPSDVTNFAANFSTDKVVFSWDKVNDVDLKGYEIRKLPFEGADWGLGTVIATNITENSYNELYNFTIGVKYYAIKAIDTSGNYSANMATASVEITSNPTQNIVKNVLLDLAKGTLSGEGEKCFIKGFSQDYWRIGLSLRTQEKWDEGVWDDGGYWDKPVSSSEAVYESEVVDLGRSFECSINIEIGLSNVEGGVLTIYIAYSDTDTNPSNWQNYAQGVFNGRYFRFKLVFSASNSNYGVDIYRVNVVFDVPDKDAQGMNISVAASGWTQIDLSGFTEVKTLIVSSSGGAYVAETDEAGLPDYFKVRLLDPANSMAQVAGSINYFARGY